jgi:hypothetical protein
MALAEMFYKQDTNSYVMRATARLYLTAALALVTENDPAGRTFWRDVGEEISMTDAYTYGLVPRAVSLPTGVQCAVSGFGPGDATGDVVMTIPANSLVIGAYAICIEAAGGTTRPSIDWGAVGEDSAGVFDGLGESGRCDTLFAEMGANPIDLGSLLSTTRNEEDIKSFSPRFSVAEQAYQNTLVSAGTGTTTGSWMICMLYITLPLFKGIGG